MKHSYQKESGNALWFILVAVALMAALTVTISRSTDTAEQSGNVESFRVKASDIMRHSSSIQRAVNDMRMRGLSENELSFENSFTSADYTNGTCADCLVFGSAGGGMSYRTPGTGWLDAGHSADPRYREWEFTGTNIVPGIRSANADLIMYVGYLKQALCTEINTLLGVTGIPVDGNGINTTAYQGAFANTSTIDNMTDLEAGCFQDTGASARDYTFYQVLIKR